MLNTLMNARYEEIGKMVITNKDYINARNEGIEIFDIIKDMLPEEGQKLLYSLEEAFSAEEAEATGIYYKQGVIDGIRIAMGIE